MLKHRLSPEKCKHKYYLEYDDKALVCSQCSKFRDISPFSSEMVKKINELADRVNCLEAIK
jgi:hypothetical protein